MLLLMTLMPLALVGLIISETDDDDDGGTANEVIRGDDLINSDEDLEEVIDLNAGVGNDTVFGTIGDDNIVAGAGDDVVFGNEGADVVVAGEGADRVFAEEGTDLVLGQVGNDFLRGGSGDDGILAGAGEDTVFGDVGDDEIWGIEAIDEEALAGNLDSPQGFADAYFTRDYDLELGEADTLNGGVGNDAIILGSNDEATGGQGDDAFVVGFWVNPEEPGTVTDFDAASEVIVYEYDGTAYSGTDQPDAEFIEGTNGAELTIDGNTIAVLNGVSAGELSIAANLALLDLNDYAFLT